MIKSNLLRAPGLLLSSLLWTALPAGLAAASDDGPSAGQLLLLIQNQQRELDKLKAALAKTQAAQTEKTTSDGPLSSLDQKFSFGGVVEIEATKSEDFASAESSDITLATVELFVDAELSDLVSTHVQFLYEDDGDDIIRLDEGFVTLGNTERHPPYLQAGKWVVPFGNFDTDMSSDPLTLDLGETKEAAVLFGVASDGFTLEGFVYNGDTQQANDNDEIEQAGLAFGYGTEIMGGEVNLGASYVRNIADSDGLTTGLAAAARALDRLVGGIEGHAALSLQSWTLRGSYMTAAKAFRAAELAFNGRGAKPKAWHLEAAYSTSINGQDVTVAATAQGTGEALALGLPERRYGTAVTLGVLEHAAITAEYLRDNDYGIGDGGTGNDGYTATLKLAVEF